MGFETPEKNKLTEVDLEDRAELLLEQLPVSLQTLWYDKIENESPVNKVRLLEKVLEYRSGGNKVALETQLLLPEGVEIFEKFPDDVKEMIEKLKIKENRIEIGYGQAGHVLSSPSQKDLCYKILFDEEKLPPGTNDISKETELQTKMCQMLDGKYGVRVPEVYGFIYESGTRAIIMELLNAPSLRKVVERKTEDMPENFDIDIFFNALEQFIKEMHSHGLYHRDLHAGNVLVDRETGMPCVIDFGLSTDTGFDEKAASRKKYIKGGHEAEIVLPFDTDMLKNLKNQVTVYDNRSI